MTRKLKEPDTEQLLLDLKEVRERLDAVGRALRKQEDADALVRKLTMQLSEAKRKAKEARWNVNVLVNAERRKQSAEAEVETPTGEAVPK